MLTTPYSNLPSTRYWRSGVADTHPTQMADIYRKKFPIAFTDRIATAGSCFAQHVANNLKKNGYNILETESLPEWVPETVAKDYGYGIYSARYGNIYTARQLLQLVGDSQSGEVRQEDVWEKDGRFFDALRPSVEPSGLESLAEVLTHRRFHLGRVRTLLSEVDVFVFTLGLTEAWQRLDSGTIYPTCPGVIAGKFGPEVFGFVNFGFFDIYRDMVAVRERLLAVNPGMRFILTVSPVPLTATATDDHVLVATTRSKSILRSVCAALADEFDNVDYFPSYEIITSPGARSFFYESNLRSVTPFGVETVMRSFFAQHPPRAQSAPEAAAAAGTPGPAKGPKRRAGPKKDDVVCEEALLEAFGK